MAHRYNREAVNNAIKQSRKPISRREAKLIHALLKGHEPDDADDTEQPGINNPANPLFGDNFGDY